MAGVPLGPPGVRVGSARSNTGTDFGRPESMVGGASNTSRGPGPAVVDMELEHAIGFSGLRSSVHVIPGTSKYYTIAGGCIILGNLQDPHDQMFLRGHDDDITCFKASKSGRFLLSGQRGHNADVCLWDTATNTPVQRFHEHEGGVTTVDITPDDSIVASVGEDRRLCFFDVSNGGIITHTPLVNVVPPTENILEVVMGPKTQDVKRRETQTVHCCVVSSTMLLCYQLNPFDSTLEPLRLNLSSFQRRFLTAKYTADGDYLIVGTEAGDVGLISMQSGAVVSTLKVCSVGVRELLVIPDNNSSAMAQEQQQQQQQAQANGQYQAPQQQGQFRYARFGPGSERTTTFYAGGGDGQVVGICIPEHSNPTLEIRNKQKLDSGVSSLSVVGTSRLSHTLVCGTCKGQVYTVQAASPEAALRPEERLKQLSDAVAAPFDLIVPHPGQPERFVSASSDGILRLWDLSTYSILGVLEFPSKNGDGTMSVARCTDMAISDGLEIMLSSWTDGCVRCHDLSSYRILWTHSRVHRGAVTALCLSPSTKFYITGSSEGEIKIWDIRSRELKGELKDHRQAILSLQLFDDDHHLLSASKDRTVVAWDLTTLRRITQLETHAGPLTTMLLSRNQYNIYTGSMDHTLAMWDIRQKEAARTAPYAPPGSEAYCTTINRSVDEQLLVTGGTDQIVQLWDERQFKVRSQGFGHSGPIVTTCFTADNKQVLSAGQDACAMIWNVYTSDD